jgi:hypothetical protein
MKRIRRTPLWLLSAALAFATLPASAAVTVTFTQPENYVDMPFSPWEKDAVMKDLRAHFDKLGAKLPQGQNLKIDVLDIDLAGQIEPRTSGTYDLRVMRGRADWPTIQLRYSVEAEGKVIKSGESRVNDMNYLQSRINRYSTNESLRYEKRMLDEWFKTLVKE